MVLANLYLINISDLTVKCPFGTILDFIVPPENASAVEEPIFVL